MKIDEFIKLRKGDIVIMNNKVCEVACYCGSAEYRVVLFKHNGKKVTSPRCIKAEHIAATEAVLVKKK